MQRAWLICEVNRSGRPFNMMSAAGAEPAVVVLDVARAFGASRVVVLGADGTDADEERRHAVACWERLPVPRPRIRVDLVGARTTAPISFELSAARANDGAS